ncbi:hypothetical protein HYPSUDRAFT_209619 [Hypholoma sublateritium FD-334 SS-4]|uniref:Uncharacterized protein n=1 Tax=Hypholoma sublateritium (strain FD-334 SS-4) TaxID=945553 RepID=A0A0D2NXZ0_HYPSF|nr:hypothetical protein HYPSUDRAFT_209619 [Hypholoma sublateritium FD-334 SS-4]
MESNSSTDSPSDFSTLSADTTGETPFDAEHTADEVIIFYRKMSISTTRRLPAENVSEGAALYVFETVKKTTKTMVSHSLTAPAQMLKNSRLGHARNTMRSATRREQADPTSPTSSPQAEMHIPMSAPSPGPVYRPKVQVFSDEMPGWPKYPEARTSNSNRDTATSPPTPSVNHVATHGQATPTNSTFASRAPPLAHPWDTPLVATVNQTPLSTSPPSVFQVAPPDVTVHPSGSFVTTADTLKNPVSG